MPRNPPKPKETAAARNERRRTKAPNRTTLEQRTKHALSKFPSKGPGHPGFRFRPGVKLDPSQVEDKRIGRGWGGLHGVGDEIGHAIYGLKRNPPSKKERRELMAQAPPKPKLLGNDSEAYRDYYRALDKWERDLGGIERRRSLEEKIQRRKNLKAQKDPKKVAQMERARTKPPRLTVGQRYGGSKVIEVHEDGSARLANGKVYDAETGKLRNRIKFPSSRKGR